ncbi:unnamed protein product (macronuclear) [Paramecium tetraurelia]|uniref:Transmembrane protein n=1 Tax=Paramecium tetraurelia TaxID=5888 RepID=A0E5M9_PARTE|nr:uncharacterized protein GSPATT00003457001 [Paramecium tetraurelia]CAK90596.1 unnamed protein product [Paramecium tetraurelia]|eukprot:XP_001457993.1 hypothetical protein (macronuclear) [Paramecium tetraurelia strain d4-2]
MKEKNETDGICFIQITHFVKTKFYQSQQNLQYKLQYTSIMIYYYTLNQKAIWIRLIRIENAKQYQKSNNLIIIQFKNYLQDLKRNFELDLNSCAYSQNYIYSLFQNSMLQNLLNLIIQIIIKESYKKYCLLMNCNKMGMTCNIRNEIICISQLLAQFLEQLM